MRRAPRNATLWIVSGAAVVVLAATFTTGARSDRPVKAGSLDVAPSQVTPSVDAVTDPPISAAEPEATPLSLPAEDAPVPALVTTPNSATIGAPSSAEPVGAAGMVVGIDPETGKVGMPSREFRDAVRESHASAAMSRSMQGLQVIHRPDGSKMIDLKDRFQEYTVIRITPDGRKEQVCVQGPDVEAALRGEAGAPAANAEGAARAGDPQTVPSTEPQER